MLVSGLDGWDFHIFLFAVCPQGAAGERKMYIHHCVLFLCGRGGSGVCLLFFFRRFFSYHGLG